LSEQGKKSEFQVYKNVLEGGGILKALCFEEKEPLSRSELDALPKKVAPYGAKGVTWIRIKGPGDWHSPQAKFFNEALKSEIEAKLPYKAGAMLLRVCGSDSVVNNSLSFLRGEFGTKFGYMSKERFQFLWVTDFPLLEYNAEDKRFYAAHHPFTGPQAQDLATFMKSSSQKELAAVKAQAYDLVLNGYEIGGGRLRIYDPAVQARMFQVLGISEEDAQQRFGFFLKALQYGTPPHGGIALGVDRITMLLAGTDAIRDVMAFPKTQKATCLMSEAPSTVPIEQVRELHLEVKLPAPKE
ncbi:MAG: amino acid--tRNA ligase-related protein, partial [Verrucomicrobiales bacterium]